MHLIEEHPGGFRSASRFVFTGIQAFGAVGMFDTVEVFVKAFVAGVKLEHE